MVTEGLKNILLLQQTKDMLYYFMFPTLRQQFGEDPQMGL